MEKLRTGVAEFQTEHYPDLKARFSKLASAQKPHTLFVACVDSRVAPILITNALPGDLFILRNIANIIPPNEKAELFPAAVATLEYAVLVLQVSNIVVCGHSNCGGCQALFQDSAALKEMTFMKKWLSLLQPLKKRLKNSGMQCTPEEIEKKNVLEQIDNLLSYPFIQKKVDEGTLQIAGWYYQIDSGKIQEYNRDSKQFLNIEQ